MKLKSILALAACAAAFVATAATSTPKGFTDDLDAALAEAKTSGKYVYACFSGSDWCGWCKKLEKEVFADKECDFVGSLKNDYLFVFIDSPNNKDLLSEKAKEMNPKQVKKFKIQGFPTALVLNGNGETVEETGYRRGGAKKYVEFLQEVRKDGDARIQKTKAKKEAEAKREKLERELNDKYFKGVHESIRSVLKPLNQGKPTPAELLKAADEVEKQLKVVEAIKFAEADAKAGAEMQQDLTKGLKRLVKMIRAAAERGKKAAEKKAAEKKAAEKKPEAKKTEEKK